MNARTRDLDDVLPTSRPRDLTPLPPVRGFCESERPPAAVAALPGYVELPRAPRTPQLDPIRSAQFAIDVLTVCAWVQTGGVAGMDHEGKVPMGLTPRPYLELVKHGRDRLVYADSWPEVYRRAAEIVSRDPELEEDVRGED